MKTKKNIFLTAFKESFKLVKKNKVLVLVIFIMQLIFFSLLFFVFLQYSIKIGQSAVTILEYVEKQDLDETTITTKLLQKEDILDPVLIYKEFENINSSLRALLIYFLLIFVIFNGLNWALTSNLISKKNAKGFFSYLGKFTIITLTYFLVIFLFLRTIISNIPLENLQIYSFLPLLLTPIIFYFMFISFALIGKNNLKEIAKKTFMLGIKKGHIIILTYAINLFIIGLFSILLLYSSELNIIILFVTLLLFVLSFIYTRIFLVLVIDRLKI